jgi:hypothetical protein
MPKLRKIKSFSKDLIDNSSRFSGFPPAIQKSVGPLAAGAGKVQGNILLK